MLYMIELGQGVMNCFFRQAQILTAEHRNAVLRVVVFRGSNKEIIDWYNANKDKIVFDPSKRKFILPEAE